MLALSETVRDGTGAFFQLFSTLADPNDSTRPLVIALEHSREVYRSECESLITLLNLCQEYCEDRAQFLDSIPNAKDTELAALVLRLSKAAERLADDAKYAADRHERVFGELEQPYAELVQQFPEFVSDSDICRWSSSRRLSSTLLTMAI